MEDNNLDNSNLSNQKKTGKLKHFMFGLVTGIVCITLVNSFVFLPVLKGFVQAKSISSTSNTDNSQSTKDLVNAKKVDRILSILDEHYIGEYDVDKMVEDMYLGLVYGVGDPYTTYMDADTFVKFSEDTEGVYAGIGVTVSVDTADNSIVVGTPFEGYPGAKAGILPGDKIIQINGFDVSGDALDKAISMMKGEPGTAVKVTIYRPDTSQILSMDIIREKINVPTVSHKMLDNNIGYIRITQFERVTKDQFDIAYDDLSQNMNGLIIDLRNNPGGLLSVVTAITDRLVPEGNIVYTEDKQGNREYSKSDGNKVNVPLIILVNGNSASASEVLSGAVQDYGVGELVGTQTFGKGIVQNIYPVGDDSVLKVTMAKYFTPNGRSIHGEGLTPNYVIDMEKELTVKISSLTLEEDVQLQKAVEVMIGKINQ